MLNGITLGVVIIVVLLIGAFVLTLLINAFLVPLFKTPKKVLQEIVDVMELEQNDHLVDLGSGDGRLLLKAHRNSSCTCTGYDISPIMLIIARTKKAIQFPMAKNIFFEAEDIYKVDLEDFSKIYCYLDEKSMRILRPRLEAFLNKKNTKIYSYMYMIDGLDNEEKILLSNDIPLYIYKGREGE